jgi:hypothetical protein
VLKLCVDVSSFLLWCIENLCLGSKFFVMVCWNFMLKLQGLWSTCVLKLYIKVLGLRLRGVEVWRSFGHVYWASCWKYKAFSWSSRCFESLHWSSTSSIVSVSNLCIEASHHVISVLRLYVDVPRSQLVVLLNLLKLFVEALGSLIILLGLFKLSIKVFWGLWLSWTRCIQAYTIAFVCYFLIFFILLFYKLCLLDISSWTLIV